MYNLTVFTFSGSQSYNPFSLQVIADSEITARELALAAVCNDALNYWSVKLSEELAKSFQSDEDISKIRSEMNKIPKPTCNPPPVDLHLGNYCVNISGFFHPVFRHPTEINGNKSVDFTEWIKTAECTSKPFNPYEVRVYSCLDG